MPVNMLDEEFVDELRDVYDAEKRFVALLQWMLLQAGDSRLQSLIKTHLRDSEQQIKNVEKAFGLLKLDLLRIRYNDAAVLIEAGQHRMREVAGNHVLLDREMAGLLAEIERLEVATYRRLIGAANRIRNREVVDLLHDNLQQEEQTAVLIEEIIRTLPEAAPQMLERAA
jgi:ferritin-like metal-binding protein YciE